MSALLQAPSTDVEQRDGLADEHKLVAAVRRGDDRAFETLYQRYHRRIHAYVCGMVKDQRRAEEVSYDADEGLAPADYGRLVSPEPVPDAAVAAKQQLDHLCGAFGGLSEAHHQILVMRELEGLSYREIGERMGLSRPSVESTLFRARRRLSAEYDEIVTGERCRRTQRLIGSLARGESVDARDKRQLARHVAYCQPCRRQARRVGVNSADVPQVRRRAGLAALFPFPFLRRRGG